MNIPQAWRWIFDQPQKSANKAEIIDEPPDSAKRTGYTLALLALLAGLTFFFGSGKIAFVGPDEPRYAEVAREMFTSGDYISTRLCGCLWFEKPALFYWLAAVAYRLFGVSEFAARFPVGLSALASMLAIYFTLSRAGFARWAKLSSLALATSAVFIAYSHAATPDMTLTAAMTVAILAGYLATRAEGRAEIAWMSLCSAALGFSVLAKGLVGIVLVVAILFIWLVLSGRLRFLPWRYFFIWLLPFFAVVASWYVPVTIRYGSEFINEFFINHHFKRFLTNVYGHPQPVYFYLVIAIVGIAPWTFFLIPAIARLRSLQPRNHERDAILTLAWVSVLVPLLFFSLSESKLPGYLLPIFPAMAMLLGAELERLSSTVQARTTQVSMWLTMLLLAAISVGFLLYLQKQAVPFSGWQAFVFLLPAIFVLPALWGGFKQRPKIFLPSAALVVLSVVVGGVVLLFPKLNEEISLKRLSLEAAAALKPEEKIGYYILKEFAAVFYAEGRVACGMGEGDVLNALKEDKLVPPLQTYPSMIFITRERWIEGLMKDGRFDVEFIGQQDEYYAFRLKLKT